MRLEKKIDLSKEEFIRSNMPLKCDSHRDEALLMDGDHSTIYILVIMGVTRLFQNKIHTLISMNIHKLYAVNSIIL